VATVTFLHHSIYEEMSSSMFVCMYWVL